MRVFQNRNSWFCRIGQLTNNNNHHHNSNNDLIHIAIHIYKKLLILVGNWQLIIRSSEKMRFRLFSKNRNQWTQFKVYEWDILQPGGSDWIDPVSITFWVGPRYSKKLFSNLNGLCHHGHHATPMLLLSGLYKFWFFKFLTRIFTWRNTKPSHSLHFFKVNIRRVTTVANSVLVPFDFYNETPNNYPMFWL